MADSSVDTRETAILEERQLAGNLFMYASFMYARLALCIDVQHDGAVDFGALFCGRFHICMNGDSAASSE